SNSFCFGGSAGQGQSSAQIGLISYPLIQGTGFFFSTYKITPEIQASLMLNYGYDRSHSSSLTANETATIRTYNAYLNPILLARMTAAGVITVSVQSNDTDPIDLNHPKYSDFSKSIGQQATQSVRQFYRAVVALDGALGDNWSWNAYYQHSESHLYEVYT